MSSNPLAGFLEEVAEQESAPVEKQESNDSEVSNFSNEPCGIVLMAGYHSCSDKKTDTGVELEEPHVLPGLDDAVKAFSSSSSSFFFILTKGKDLYASGSNTCGQLGLGNTNPQWLPTKVPISAILPKIEVKKVSTGKSHALLLSTSGRLYATGSNLAGTQ